MADNQPPGIHTLQQQLIEARNEAELNLLQLQQVQEKLENHLREHRQLSEELQRYRLLQQQAEALVEALLQRLESGSG